MSNRKWSLVIAFFMLVANVYAQRMSREEYLRKYQQLAISEMVRSGVPASIKMAQAMLESDNGNSNLAQRSNNHFGIKCKTGWTGGKVYHDDDEKNECFRKYRSVEDSYVDHTEFLRNNPRYAFLFQLPIGDYEEWARGLKKAGYATHHSYDKLLIKVIEDNQLWRLDQGITSDQLAQFEQRRVGGKVDGTVLINPYSSRKITLHNGLKSVVTREGDTFETLAQEFALKTWELYRFNDYPKGYQPKPNEIIYLQGKKKKASGASHYHVVTEGESMHYISQYYGIRLKPLYRRNDMRFGDPIQIGQVLSLQKPKK